MLKRFDVNLNPRNTATSLDVLWSPPYHGWTKCNVDGVAIVSPWKWACGGIFKDSKAKHILSFNIPLSCEPPSNAELLAAIIAMEKAMDLQLNKFWLESDYTLVVKTFYNHALVPWTIRSLWLVYWSYMMIIDFMITHIFREANFCANILASVGLDCNSSFWFHHVYRNIRKDFI
ncbi:uncharacterized protein LOC131623580 [Vicia villosa]|uniref:uncharacterized protein LOC131623580 n=1 Tax=Vicia villosa TaxID=3911 RepID=UPI00273B9DAC|nr:uncharacterized protein LOC131623580 [Vicia villosa]